MKQTDIEKYVKEYTADMNPYSRYASFDFCYNYFHKTESLHKDLEKSCLALGFYLASWGMYRGSSFILQTSVRNFDQTIDLISNMPRSYWEIDVNNYSAENISIILDIYENIKESIVPYGKTHLTLVTKIMLGVFGFIPAFDDNFCNTFRYIFGRQCRFRSFNEKSLLCLKEFYEENNEVIDRLSNELGTIDFVDDSNTGINYPKAKVIDMYGWQKFWFLKEYGLI